MTSEYTPGEPPDECNKCLDECRCPPTDNGEAGRGCLNCGTCETCIERSIAAADEWPDFGTLSDDPEACPHCDGTGWQGCGIVAIECPECGGCDGN